MFPSILSTFNRPTATSRLNSPSHSALHNTVSSAVGQIEAVIGVEGAASVPGTLEYFIKSPDSDGGGHIQTANKGGTGQTTFTKGDLLVATSQSVIAKLGVSSTSGDVLVADPNQSGGMKWSPVISNKLVINLGSISTSAGAASGLTVLYAASIAGSTIGNGNAIKFTGVMQKIDAFDGFTLALNYGVNLIGSVTLTNTSSVIGSQGIIQGTIAGNGTSSQVGFISLDTAVNGIATPGVRTIGVIRGLVQGISSVNASAQQDLVITGKFSGSNINSILTGMFIVEKIA